jgi:Zn-finger nucleic acid-binding protein
MKCPRDGAELAKVKVTGIELEKCHHCDGLWFDAGELDRVRKLDRTEIEEQIEKQYGNPVAKSGEVEGYMRCPRCVDGRLQQITYTFEKQVKIDRCEHCLGVWVDDRELDAILGEKQSLEKMPDSSPLKAFMRAAGKLLR